MCPGMVDGSTLNMSPIFQENVCECVCVCVYVRMHVRACVCAQYGSMLANHTRLGPSC